MLLESFSPVQHEARRLQSYGYTVIALAYASLLLAAVATMGSGSILQRFFTGGIMRAFGKYSYAAYVWHRMVAPSVQACERKIHTPLPWFVEIPLMIAATFAVSMASYALIERPFLALKRYFEPREESIPQPCMRPARLKASSTVGR